MPRPRRKAFYGTGDDIHLSRIVPTKRQSACPAVVSRRSTQTLGDSRQTRAARRACDPTGFLAWLFAV